MCGIDLLASDGPGFSVGGGITGPDVVQLPCPGCVQAAQTNHSGNPVCADRPSANC
jgi:hypothetical protein